MLKKVWGIIFIVLGVASFILGGYEYYNVENFSNFARAFGFVNEQGNDFFSNLIQSNYSDSYMFLGIGVFLALLGSFMIKISDKKEKIDDNNITE